MDVSRKTVVGVDVSKAFLDAHRLPDGAELRVENNAPGFQSLIDWSEDAEPVVFEATGPYHRGLETALHEADVPLCKVNPARARDFAKATGQLAKTDRTDARCLANMGASLELPTTTALSATRSKLKALTVYRVGVVRDLVVLKNRQCHLYDPETLEFNARRLRVTESDLERVNARIAELCEKEEELARGMAILTSIPGVGPVSASILLAEMPELGTLDAKSAASLAGVAPMARDSGTRRGRRYVQGGRRRVRKALYMPALSAKKFNPDLSRKYEELTAAGKEPMVALGAVMRKLVVLANALMAADREWTPKPVRA